MNTEVSGTERTQRQESATSERSERCCCVSRREASHWQTLAHPRLRLLLPSSLPVSLPGFQRSDRAPSAAETEQEKPFVSDRSVRSSSCTASAATQYNDVLICLSLARLSSRRLLASPSSRSHAVASARVGQRCVSIRCKREGEREGSGHDVCCRRYSSLVEGCSHASTACDM